MARERTAPPAPKHDDRPSFFKFNRIGQTVAGILGRIITNRDGGSFAIFSPVVIGDGNGQPRLYKSAAINLSTDLRFKIDKTCEGLFLMISYKEDEPTTKGSPKRVFSVTEYEKSKPDDLAIARDIFKSADPSQKDSPYKIGPDAIASDPIANFFGDDDDDLPF